MNSDQFVPISVIAGFAKVRQLTTDAALVLEVLRSSKEVSVNESGELVRPNVRPQRSTLILRDIPSDIPLTVSPRSRSFFVPLHSLLIDPLIMQEMEAVFKHPDCATVKRYPLPSPFLSAFFSLKFKFLSSTRTPSLRPDVGNTWFVSFDNEEDALKTLAAIRNLTLRDQPIQARVKSEHPTKTL